MSADRLLFLEFFQLSAEGRIKQDKENLRFEEAYGIVYSDYLKSSDDVAIINLTLLFVIRNRTARYTADFKNTYTKIESAAISSDTVLGLLNKYFLYLVHSPVKQIIAEEILKDNLRRYSIEEEILIPMKDGAEISAVVVRRKGFDQPLPALLGFSIYAEKNSLWAMLSASKGYVGVIANTRGKRLSKDEVALFKYENTDVYETIDWISKQEWCNNEVGMYGGSYDGFTQWASMKHKVHPALKTIVPSVAIVPGIDYPMENNVLHNFSYSWNFMVTNNKYLDYEVSGDFNRWNNLKNTWYQSGVAFNKLDSLDGEVNMMFTDYRKHPSYDDYWRSMIPYKEEFAKIDIPILSITGYYDDSQRGAFYYYNQHLKYNENANHYLLVGPYDHWTSQDGPQEYLRNYKLDKAAQLKIRYELVYEWFDYILKGTNKPEILKDKVNFQVMDTNSWMHKPSLSAMTNDTLSFHLSSDKNDGVYQLNESKIAPSAKIDYEVDLNDRTTMTNADYYPWPLEKDEIDLKDGLVFMSEPFEKDVIINGLFLGEIVASINKNDFDFSVILYELTPENKYFHLSYYIGRASFAKNREQRELLTPNQMTAIPFNNPKMISKNITAGSRIVVVINVNKNNNAQINYGTGKDVNIESIKDASAPLRLTLNGNSKIQIPVWESRD